VNARATAAALLTGIALAGCDDEPASEPASGGDGSGRNKNVE
jgi:hypothetical protein